MARILEANVENIAAAGERLRNGKLVAFPTETVYGLGGDATNDRAVAAIFEAKARPNFNPLIVHVPDIAEAKHLAEFSPRAELLARKFWPGPLTLVLPRKGKSRISLLASAGLDSIALRVPGHQVALSLLKACRLPLAAPSANPSGRLSPTRAAHVADGLKDRVDIILDGGPCAVGLESTVLSLLEDRPRVLRPGAVTADEIQELLGEEVLVASQDPNDGSLHSPGQLLSHYAPNLPVRMNASEAGSGEALLGFGPQPNATLNLSPGANLAEAAANLFAMLRQLDDPRYLGIAVAPVPDTGLGVAINDRLRRAASGRNRSA